MCKSAFMACAVKGLELKSNMYTLNNIGTYTHSDDSLDVTLDKLLALLREEVGPRWYDFGEAVGIDEVVLDSIAKTTFP